ncbi:hypothetical protein [Williamsia sp. CHRR-6]|uniref:hypothetical protein n=1 Tax=Williamsia sp. CHRR-6 TaxID=2835871 RepID=UPI001BD91441|nr:hypothetical protein [Williamsia sp. CHRR-6]MBT0565294.1 hypothetical protein [Williamsia sp. CHRR-6]
MALAAGCGSDAPRPAAGSSANYYDEARTSGVNAALTALAAAQRSGDRTAIDAVVDPSATTAFRDGLLLQAQAIRSVGVDAFGYRIGTRLREDGIDELLLPAGVQDRLDAQGATDSWVSPIEITYTLAGFAESPITIARPLVMVRYGDRWKVLGDAAQVVGEQAGLAAPTPQFWDFPGSTAVRVATAGGESVVVSYPGSVALGRRLGSALPGAVAAVSAFWGPQWPRRAAVIAADTPAEFGALSGSAAAVSEFAAAATISAPGNGPTVGQRVVFTPEAATLAGPALDLVLRHELFHVAAAGRTGATAAKWITEGVAEYVGRKGTFARPADAAPDLATAVRTGRPPPGLPTDADFTLTGAGSAMAYQTAWSFAQYVATTSGEVRLRGLYLALSAGPTTVSAQESAITAALGQPSGTVLLGWRNWLLRSF